MRFEFFIKVIVELILNGCFRKLKGLHYLIFGSNLFMESVVVVCCDLLVKSADLQLCISRL